MKPGTFVTSAERADHRDPRAKQWPQVGPASDANISSRQWNRKEQHQPVYYYEATWTSADNEFELAWLGGLGGRP